MKTRPILYNDEMVRAILAGTKTQTRRPVNMPGLNYIGPSGCVDDPEAWGYEVDDGYMVLARGHNGPLTHSISCPFGVVGDRLWVRESAMVCDIRDSGHQGRDEYVRLKYRADGAQTDWLPWPERLKPPTLGHCVANGVFREGARCVQEITAVRVERLQTISNEGATREGFVDDLPVYTARGFVKDTWDAIYGGVDTKTQKPRWSGWAQNPFVWVIETKVISLTTT